ncbi:MAG: hypothetical protein N3A63_05970 [Bacteroidetes bacterium]|nr:hypothetical protein [Bacteroidota bacterium]
MPIFSVSTGSVMMIVPKKLISTVEWPIHAIVMVSLDHECGVGLSGEGFVSTD